jgi:primary-amine oxidase
MSLASLSLVCLLSTLFLLTLRIFSDANSSSGRGRARLVSTTGALLALVFLALPAAQAQIGDRILINGSGCKVTEENALGTMLASDLYLRVDFTDSHWRFGLRNQGLKGMALVDVAIQAAQLPSRQYIIKHAGLIDMFVPYDDRSHTYYDMSFGNDRMDQMDAADLPAQNSSLVYFRNRAGNFYTRDAVPKIGVECRDAGVAWLCKEGGSRVRRRAQEVVVWAVFDAFNYDYIIEYTFHEDGSITFRDGATGYNLPGGTSKSHVHNPMWRVSTKLFNRTDNQAFEFEHVEDSNGYIGTDSDNPILTEQAVDFDPLRFTDVLVQSASQTNTYGHLMGYEFTPSDLTGIGHFQEQFSQHDEYLTNDNPGEDGSGSGFNNWRYSWYNPNDYLLRYLNNEPLGGTGDGIVFWYIASVHHEPSDNDNQRGNGGRTGITLIHWAGFEMEPHNMFDYNPLGGPAKCGG